MTDLKNSNLIGLSIVPVIMLGCLFLCVAGMKNCWGCNDNQKKMSQLNRCKEVEYNGIRLYEGMYFETEDVFVFITQKRERIVLTEEQFSHILCK